MDGDGRRTQFDSFRFFLFLFMMGLLLAPGKNNSSHLRDTAEMRLLKKIKHDLNEKLVIDSDSMMRQRLNYAYNISGRYNGQWSVSPTSYTKPISNISLGLVMEFAKKEQNKTLKGSGGDLSLQLYDQGNFRKNIHRVSGSATFIEGELDTREDSLTLSFIGVYFLPTGHLTLFANTNGCRYFLKWNSTKESEKITVNNSLSNLVGWSRNGTNLLYISDPEGYDYSPEKCVYKLDVDMSPLAATMDPDIAKHENRRMALNATGGMMSVNCHTNIVLSLSGYNMDTKHISFKSYIYTVCMIIVSFAESVVYLREMQSLLLVSATGASLLMFILLASIDLLYSMMHSLIGVLFMGLFSGFFPISFHKLFVFSIIDMRIIFFVWKARNPEMNNTNYERYQRQISGIFVFLYALIIVTIISLYSSSSIKYYLLFFMSSFWLPQIIRSIQIGQRSPISTKGIFSITLLKLFLPLYVFVCPHNLLSMFMEKPIPYTYGYILIGWVLTQMCIVYIQKRYNPYLILPPFLRPRMYDYHAIPATDAELDQDCAICMSSIDYSDKGSYMITPCHHVFHTECLYKWMDIKLECPSCRSMIPDVRYL